MPPKGLLAAHVRTYMTILLLFSLSFCLISFTVHVGHPHAHFCCPERIYTCTRVNCHVHETIVVNSISMIL